MAVSFTRTAFILLISFLQLSVLCMNRRPLFIVFRGVMCIVIKNFAWSRDRICLRTYSHYTEFFTEQIVLVVLSGPSVNIVLVISFVSVLRCSLCSVTPSWKKTLFPAASDPDASSLRLRRMCASRVEMRLLHYTESRCGTTGWPRFDPFSRIDSASFAITLRCTNAFVFWRLVVRNLSTNQIAEMWFWSVIYSTQPFHGILWTVTRRDGKL
jgi:hypothetical protein